MIYAKTVRLSRSRVYAARQCCRIRLKLGESIRPHDISVGNFLLGAPALRRRERSARVRPRGAAGPKSARKSEIAAEREGRSAGDVKIELELSKSRRMQKTPVKKLQRLKHGA